MSKKNPVDELFRQGLDNKGLAYSGTHWDKMEDLIQSAEQSRSRNYKWYWAGLAFLIITGGCWLALNNRSEKSTAQDGNVPAEQNAKPDESFALNNNNNETNEAGIAEKQGYHRPDINRVNEEPSTATTANDRPGEASAGPVIRSVTTGTMDITTVNEEVRDEANERSLDNFAGFTARPVYSGANRPSIEGIYARPISPSFIPWLTESGFFEMAPPRLQAEGNSPFLPKRQRFQWFINPYFSYGRYHHLHCTDVAGWKKGVEEPEYRLGYGLDVRIKKNRISLLTGIGISQYRESTNYISANNRYTFDTSYQMVKRNYSLRPDGSYVALIKENVDTTVHPGDTILCRDCPTRFTYWTIPLVAQYEFGGNKWSYFGEAGFNFSIYRNASGTYSTAQANGPSDAFSMATGNIHRTDMAPLLVQFRASAGVRYHVHRRVSVNGSLNYSRSLHSMMRNYSQQPVVYGFRVGLEWNFAQRH